MKTTPKTIISLVITTSVPIVGFSIISSLFGLVFLIRTMISRDAPVIQDIVTIFQLILLWNFLHLFVSVPVTFGHVFLLGVPALLLCWYFRAIRWWSTLVVSFIIGATPTIIYLLFIDIGFQGVKGIGWTESSHLWQDFTIANFNIVSISIVASVATIMGFLGLSGGLVFWLLWRYWVLPSSSSGRPLSLLPKGQIK